jgi:pyruvate/2-oxoglutarate dehydrogenase complex dihydrolipoamide acyltransferase (E2) component
LFVRKIKIIFVEPGQAVKADDIIAKIETDKVTVDILA